MIEQNEDDALIVNGLVQSLGLRYPVTVSAELAALLKPNAFLMGLGIRYEERLKTILGVLKGNMAPQEHGTEDALPKGGTVIPFAIAKGPYIKEDPVAIRAELKDDGGEAEILLTAILNEE